MTRSARSVPVFYCSDKAVQAFVDEELRNIGPYSQPEFTPTAREVFEMARARFGDMACWDLRIVLH